MVKMNLISSSHQNLIMLIKIMRVVAPKRVDKKILDAKVKNKNLKRKSL